MRVPELVIALAMTSLVSLHAQIPLKSATINFKVISTTLADLLNTIERTTGIDLQLDDTVSEEARNHKFEHILFRNASLEGVLTLLTNQTGLTFEVIDEKTVRIRAKP